MENEQKPGYVDCILKHSEYIDVLETRGDVNVYKCEHPSHEIKPSFELTADEYRRIKLGH